MKTAKKTSCLVELIDKYKKWRRDNGEAVSGSESGEKEKPQQSDSKDFWDLNTIRGAPAELTQEKAAEPELAREDSKKVSSRSGESGKKKTSRSHREGKEGRERKDKTSKSSVC